MNPTPFSPQIRKWALKTWLALIAIVFAAHVALLLIFGAREPISPRPVVGAPSLALAGESTAGWLALNNATLFALPNSEGFAGPAWIEPPPVGGFHEQDWTDTNRWLDLPASELGAAFNHFMQTSSSAEFHLGFNMPPPLAVPVYSTQAAFPQNSMLQIEGEISQRRLLHR